MQDFLSPRTAAVIVQGRSSDSCVIRDQIYQGTILGPPLWNIFFADISSVAENHSATEVKFADDFNIFKFFDKNIPNENIVNAMQRCQADIHKWGKMNRAVFDAGKEHIVVLHRQDYYGDTFKLLGGLVNPQLLMANEINRILKKVRPQIKLLLRTRYFYSVRDMILQFKTHILCVLEGTMDMIFYTNSTRFNALDHILDSFLSELNVSSQDAFFKFNLAPLKFRRNIGMLGFIHKAVLGHSHRKICALFPPSLLNHNFNTRLSARLHNKQLFDRCSGRQSQILHQSIFD